MERAPSPHGLPGSLNAALAAFRRQGLAVALEDVYQRLPATTCARQGHCCGLLPPLAPVEMLAWLDGLQARPAAERAEQIAAMLEHFLTNAAQRRPCPWAQATACAIYPVRFLACRAYGLWSPEAYAGRRQAALMAQERIAQAWAGLGVTLPAEVLAPGPEYCQQVRVAAPGENLPRADDLLHACESEMERLAKILPPDPDVPAAGGDLSHLLARLVLGPRGCLTAKVRVTKALLAGQKRQARQILDQHLAVGRAWAATWEETPS
ncbi:MAG: hypothetical protein HY910_15450 [Desulfarculus sp.]|nr:hypothetical protein [Desulfarculus sp.]